MIIKKLKLKNFRNYSKLNIELSDKLNIFIGDNAQGKSNILESIVVLALTKSYMSVKDENLIKDGEDVAIIESSVLFDDTTDDLFISFDGKNKKIKINNNEIKKYSDYISKIRFVLFSPLDISLIKDSPAVRRKYFNVEISQLSNNYIKLLQKFNAILKKRNQFLKMVNETGVCNDYYLKVLDDNFSTIAVEIVLERKKFIDKLNGSIGNIYFEITKFNNLSINYISNVLISDNKDKMKDDLVKKLKDNFTKDKFYGVTSIGPHRDDYSMILDGNDLSIYGSQGQNRSAILALKLSELSIFKEITGDYPILLLDDIFSELDIDKRNRLVKYILNDIQTIITTTDLNMIDKSLVDKAKIFNVSAGKVVAIEKEGNKHE